MVDSRRKAVAEAILEAFNEDLERLNQAMNLGELEEELGTLVDRYGFESLSMGSISVSVVEKLIDRGILELSLEYNSDDWDHELWQRVFIDPNETPASFIDTYLEYAPPETTERRSWFRLPGRFSFWFSRR